MATSDYGNTVNYNVTISQKEHCASIAMRGTVKTLAAREKIKLKTPPLVTAEELFGFTKKLSDNSYLSFLRLMKMNPPRPIIARAAAIPI